jgi:hypothetical protein
MSREIKPGDRVRFLPNAFGGGIRWGTVKTVAQFPSLWLPKGETRLGIVVRLEDPEGDFDTSALGPDQFTWAEAERRWDCQLI